MLKFINSKLVPTLIAGAIAFGSFNVAGVAANSAQTIDSTLASKGVLTVNYDDAVRTQHKLLVEKDGVRYTYDLDEVTKIPLQLGNGNYLVRVLEKVEGTRYRVLTSSNVNVTLANANAPYLQSVQNINWNTEMAAIKKAQELTKDLKTDKQKVTAIYNYLVQNVEYDYQKAKTVSVGYIPNTNDTFRTNTGICYDYASLFAAMLRSVNIPTKIVTGYTTHVKEYHAWNDVYLDGKWTTIDTTVDAAYKNSKKKPGMIKNNKDYKQVKQY